MKPNGLLKMQIVNMMRWQSQSTPIHLSVWISQHCHSRHGHMGILPSMTNNSVSSHCTALVWGISSVWLCFVLCSQYVVGNFHCTTSWVILTLLNQFDSLLHTSSICWWHLEDHPESVNAVKDCKWLQLCSHLLTSVTSKFKTIKNFFYLII